MKSGGGASTKIQAAVDSYGYPVYLMLSEGPRNDINYAIPVLEEINIEGNQVFERHCDWRQYKERHLIWIK